MHISAIVHDSFYTVSGRIFATLEAAGGRLPVGIAVIADDGAKWTIIDNDVKIDRKYLDMLRERAGEGAYLYELQPMEHQRKPDMGQVLRSMAPP